MQGVRWAKGLESRSGGTQRRAAGPSRRTIYRDESGELLFQTVRYDPKDFNQRRPNGNGGWTWNLDDTRLVLYNLERVLESDTVWFCEGEKCADDISGLDLCGTTAPLGAGKCPGLVKKHSIHDPLRGKKVYILPDNDVPGRNHALEIGQALVGFAASVKIVELPGLKAKGDVSDFIEKRGPEEAKRLLLELTAKTPDYHIDREPALIPSTPCEIPVHMTDLGNTRRFAALFGNRIRWCKGLGWLVYDGKRWVEDNTAQIQSMAKAVPLALYKEAANELEEDRRKSLASWALKTESASKLKSMIDLLPSEPGIAVSHEVFDRDPMLLNVLNGTLDLRTGQIRDHSPDDLITKLAPVEYDPDAKCPRFDDFLPEIMNGVTELPGFLQRLLGYGLTGRTNEQVWAFFWGKGENGKSTILETVRSVAGDYVANVSAESFMESKFQGIRNDLARLRGARIVTAGEPAGKRFDAATVKLITGEDMITCRFLHREHFEFKPEALILFSSNYRPQVRDTSHAFWRRILLIPFTRIFSGEDKDENLRETLKKEAAGILNWLVKGCLAWQAVGLQIPDSVRIAVNEYRASTDVLADFFEECCVIGPAWQVAVKDLYSDFLGYCEAKSIRKPMSRQKFNEDLLTRPDITRANAGLRDRRIPKWFGVGLKSARDLPRSRLPTKTSRPAWTSPTIPNRVTCEHIPANTCSVATIAGLKAIASVLDRAVGY